MVDDRDLKAATCVIYLRTDKETSMVRIKKEWTWVGTQNGGDRMENTVDYK